MAVKGISKSTALERHLSTSLYQQVALLLPASFVHESQRPNSLVVTVDEYKQGQVRHDGMILTSFGWRDKAVVWIERSELHKAIEAGWRLVEGRDLGHLVRVKR